MHKLMAAAASLCGLLPALTLAQNVGQGGPNALPNLELAAKTSDALPKSRDALFDDDDMTSSPSSAPSAPATPAPGKKESLFLDDQPAAAPAKPATTAATDSGKFSGIKGFAENVMAYTLPRPSHWSEMMFRTDLSAQGDLGSGVKWKLGARADFDATYSLTDHYPSAVADNQRFNLMLRENYLDIGAGDWDFRLGRQHVIWGEMVGLLFADVVSARDMRQFLLPEFEILRIPQWAARAEYFKDDFHAELLWIPVASYDEIGKPGAEFFNYTLPVPAGVATVYRNEQRPSRRLSNSNYGLRLSLLKNGWDVAAFAYHSLSVAPTFYREIVSSPQPTAIFQARHDRITQYGMTLGKDLGPVVLKAEAVYTDGMNYQVKDPNDVDGVVAQKTLNWAVGLDYTEIADTRFNVQFFQSHFFNHSPDIIQDKNENGYSLLANRKFGDKVEAQVLYIASLNRSDWLLRPRMTWNFEKNWRFAVGADIFHGPPLGFFGRYDRSDRVYTELRYSF
ncbi:MAG TPA: hypothetical protein PLS39_07070 [Accumulibacter sp.]|nr:DUF1302 family protein [Accumulibacter sp.]HMX21824.1 hypothetical protein [Accumulibacter sp.]HMY05885.1 hypothetical protein [Accumulibacter sp.]HND80178.1 hypothetical protein [Accumulibacter sp.]HNE13362.1 hypothetical protein [Accumulibacter sp.]